MARTTKPFAAALLVAVLALAGCVDQGYDIKHPEVVVMVQVVDVIKEQPKAFGYSTCTHGVCTIQIRRETYPDCITHEVRHAIEGNWHAGRETTEDCRRE